MIHRKFDSTFRNFYSENNSSTFSAKIFVRRFEGFLIVSEIHGQWLVCFWGLGSGVMSNGRKIVQFWGSYCKTLTEWYQRAPGGTFYLLTTLMLIFLHNLWFISQLLPFLIFWFWRDLMILSMVWIKKVLPTNSFYRNFLYSNNFHIHKGPFFLTVKIAQCFEYSQNSLYF